MADSAITTPMHTNLYEIFGQRDPALRREAIARTYTEDIAFTDESGTIVGRTAIDDRVEQVLGDAPESFAFAPDGPIYVGEDTAALAWRLGPADSDPVARGIDIATLKDGRISAIQTLLS
jgi:SnoaL-like domain